jgi:hypothetical protein
VAACGKYRQNDLVDGRSKAMTTTDTTGGAGADEAARRDALADRLFMSLIEANELASVWLACG